ncbi:hypothetical protein, partial [Neisseria sicca]|uniref:hypothetical protein n=1 Tax=Neisseria sicca TaxID=490 RepID=UPI001C9A1331
MDDVLGEGAEVVEKFGDFGISLRMESGGVVEEFGFGRRYFCCDGGGRKDAGHLGVEDVGFLLSQ